MAAMKKTSTRAGAGQPALDLDELAQEIMKGGPVLASSLPDEFVGQITAIEERTDKQGRKCLFVTIEGDFGITVMKFGKQQSLLLKKALEKLGYIWEGFVANLPSRPFLWRRYRLSMREYPRHYPVSEVK